MVLAFNYTGFFSLVLCLFLIPSSQPPTTRQVLISLIFGGSLPTRQPDTIQSNIIDPAWIGTPNLQRIDGLTVNLDYGLTSIIYHFIPATGNSQLFIFHGGHGQDFNDGRDFILDGLARGYSMAAINMPLSPRNGMPDVAIQGHTWHLFNHTQMQFLRPAVGHPLRYFLEPVVIFLNYADTLDYDHISMAGISGGGWSTTLAAALDSRIQNSYPVAGSMPLWVRDLSDWGDYEQHDYSVYGQVSYEDIYIQGAANGRQLQILNRYDSCCYAGLRWQQYYQDVRDRSGGQWDLWNDETHTGHIISPAARIKIFGELEGFSVWNYYYPYVRK